MADQQWLDELVARLGTVEHRAQQHEHERSKILVYLRKMAANIEHQVQKRDISIDELVALRRQHIKDLVTYIFPISEIHAKR
jgi:hypothetical protein